jgi:excisionase family DNA binding protein
MQKTKMTPAFLRPAEAAKYLGVSARTIRAWQTRRFLPFARMSKRCVLISVADLDAAVEKFRVEAIGQ